jgi:hypothetical protein
MLGLAALEADGVEVVSSALEVKYSVPSLDPRREY